MRSLAVVAALLVLGVACGDSGVAGDAPLGDAVAVATAARAEADEPAMARLGDWREVRFYPDGDLRRQPNALRVQIAGVEVRSLMPWPGWTPRPTAVVYVAVENPTSSSAYPPRVSLVTPNGRALNGYAGDWGATPNLGEMRELPARTRFTGAIYVALVQEGIDPPPASFAGWTVVVESTGAIPREGVRAVWRLD